MPYPTLSNCSIHLLALAACLSSAKVGQGQAPPAFIRGDVNLDGQVTLADASRYFDFRFFGAPAPDCLDAMDVRDDGQIDSFGIADGERLLDWLFRTFTPPLPPPFPQPGTDPTMDGLGCTDPTLSTPGEPDPGFSFQWLSPAAVSRRETGVTFFVLVTTSAPIESFSIAYRVDRRVLQNVEADLEDTIFPQGLRSAFETSPVFGVALYASADPDFDLLQVGAIWIADTGGLQAPGEGGGGAYQRISFAATEGRMRGARLLRIVADVRADAPLGERVLLQPAQEEDFLVAGRFVHGVKNEIVVLDAPSPGQSNFPIAAASDPTIVFQGEEFLRADANADLKVDISDPVATLEFLFLGGQPLPCPDSGDANDDGKLDISDASFALGYLFLGTADPPMPGPMQCGGDPTDDTLDLCLEGCP